VSKKYKILVISIFSFLVLSFVIYDLYHFYKMKNNIHNKYYTAQVDLDKQITDNLAKLTAKQKELDDLKMNTLYGFFYNPSLNKIVYKTYKMDKQDFNLKKIISLLSNESNDTIKNFYKDISVNKSEINERTLVLDITISGWNSISVDNKYNTLTSLLWTLYSSTNLDKVILTVDSKNITLYNSNIDNIYHRYYFNPLNDTIKFSKQSSEHFKYFPITYDKNGFGDLESNFTMTDTDLRIKLDEIGKQYNLPIENIIFDDKSNNGIVRIDINLKDKKYNIDQQGKDKDFIHAIQESFKLSMPFKHYLYINSSVNLNPIFLNFSFENNPILNK
jgi:hypothetical protein